MDEVVLPAEHRIALGRKVGALRRSGITPIHVYGRGEASLSLQADTYNLIRTLGAVGRTSPLTVKVDGAEHFVMVREIQRHPVNERLLHVDLLRISRTERVRAAVPLLFEGESLGARDEGAILSEELHEIEVEALPTDLPHDIVVDISSMTEPDSVIRASDLPLPAGVTLAADPDAFVARVLHRRSASEDDEGGAPAPDAPDEVGAVAAPVEDSAATD